MKVLKEKRLSEAREIRCLVEKKAIYDRVFGGVKHSGFVLSIPNSDAFIFAYVPLATEKQKRFNEELLEVLQYGKFVMALKRDEPVRVSVRFGEKGYFEITDFKHAEWVTP